MAVHFSAIAVGLAVFACAALVGGDNGSAKHLTVLGTICLVIAVAITLLDPSVTPGSAGRWMRHGFQR